MYDYMLMDSNKQALHLLHSGEIVSRLIKDNKLYVLYALGKFFVELQYKGNPKIIYQRKLFQSGKELDKYVSLEGFALADQ